MGVFGQWMWAAAVRKHGAEKVFDHCALVGVTDVFFLVKGLEGTAAFRKCDKAVSFADPSRDLLSEALDAAHDRGIRLHAWLTSASDALYKSAHPTSGLFHLRDGRNRDIVSITDAGYTAYMSDVVFDLCGNYDIDGLHLDYIRYNHLLYGWSDGDMACYEAAGADAALLRGWVEKTFYEQDCSDFIFNKYREGEPNARILAKARRGNVARFARTLLGAAKARKPNLTLSAALMPEGAYDDTAFSSLHYGQSYDDARALYDMVLPMAYSLAYKKNSDWVRQVACQTAAKGLKTIVGIHAFEDATTETLAADIAAAKDAAADGICLFRNGRHVYAIAEETKTRLINATDMQITRVEIGERAENVMIAPMGDVLLDGGGTVRAFWETGEIAALTV
ncbi:MAG: family 10 glycosylhydrolase [Oscillospiraceae bacterium]|jgi:uncharacterized lipoprotein YddW (UPF0748 family)|nr:family 10 glycosylhydrolase [Oscillospiraceae bacterium]